MSAAALKSYAMLEYFCIFQKLIREVVLSKYIKAGYKLLKSGLLTILTLMYILYK
jgi:hypothetical protein